jgi:choline dehydrogenase-like flavoprotein
MFMSGLQTTYDALIVGSGASGGWVAKELTEAGMRVLMLEAGPPVIPSRDFTEHAWTYQLKYRGFDDLGVRLQDQPIQWAAWVCNEYNHQFFINDQEHPYTFPLDKPFMWVRGRQVGGKTICWGRESYRYSDYDFKAASRDGYGQDWPFDYKEIEPYYDKVESFIGLSASYEGLAQMPDGKFLPPMNLSCGSLLAKRVIESKFGWRVMPDRVANLTVPLNGRPACHYCNECSRGCFTTSYFNSPSVTLPAAAKSGRFALRSDAVVSHVVVDNEGQASGVHYIDRVTHKHAEARAKIVILAASALESTRILLNSSTRRYPHGLGNSTDVLGHYLMDHFTIEGAGGMMPTLRSSVREPTGNPCGFLIPKYANVGSNKNKGFIRGYRFDGDASQDLYGQAFSIPGYGKAFRDKVRTNIPYGFDIEAQGETLPRYENYVTLDKEKKDAWGIPVLHIVSSYGENEYSMSKAMREDIMAILDAMKLEDMRPPREELSVLGKNIHECGTARMGNDPKTSVLNKFNRLHDAKNVFVVDGACFVTNTCYEPTLTIMAIAARAADYIAGEYRRGNL